MSSLLPQKSTAAEHALAESVARISDVPVPIREIHNPDLCPVALLPYLAWAYSVDVFDSTWSEVQQRNAIKASRALHKRKGTRGAVEDAVSALGGSVLLREWWEKSPAGMPGTFEAVIATGGATVTAEFQNQLIAAIDRTKPESAHYTVGIGIDEFAEVGVLAVARVALFQRLEFTG